jgi:transcriptional regulator with XRE-family HTH domain
MRLRTYHGKALLLSVEAAERTRGWPLQSPHRLLYALRRMLRMSQRELSERSGVGRANIARFEAGSVDPSLSTVEKLLDGMGCAMVLLPRPRRRLRDGRASLYELRRAAGVTATSRARRSSVLSWATGCRR